MKNQSITSVVMPVFNGEKYLKTSINSILEQSLVEYEFIIVNDGSTDTTSSILSTFCDRRITIVNQENGGVAHALNEGLKRASGEYIARMDADDISFPFRLAKQKAYLDSNPEIVCVGSNAEVIDMHGEYIHTTNHPTDSESLMKRLPYSSPFIHPSVMYRRKAIDEMGGYDNIPLVEDLVFFNKLAQCGRFANIREPLLKYRITPEASSRRNRRTLRQISRFIGEYVDNGRISDADRAMILRYHKSMSIDQKYGNYHLQLARKYLWKNLDPERSRTHIAKAISHDSLNLYSYPLYLVSWFPLSIIRRLYKFKQ